MPTPKSSRRSIRQMGRRSVKLADLLSTSLSKSKEDDSGSDSNDVPQNVSKKLEFSDENESNDETAPKPMSADTPMSLTPASGKSRGSSAINRKRNRNAKVKGTPFPNRNKNPRKSILKSASKFASETVSSAGSDMDTPVKKRMKPNSGTSLTPFLSSMQGNNSLSELNCHEI